MFNITNIPEVNVYKIAYDTAIINVQYNTRYELCSSFMRMQEFYESDIDCIKGRYFTIDTYMDEYAKKNGGFSYTMDWSGFNIPSKVYHEFNRIFFRKLIKKEKILNFHIQNQLNTVFGASFNCDKFYIIGSYKDCPRQASVIEHEIAHALYSLDEDYKYHADVNCGVVPFRDDIIKVLKDWGYADSVIKDELQAYIATNCTRDWESFPTVDLTNKEFIEIRESLLTGFNMCCKKYGITLPVPHSDEELERLETEYKAKYGYNAGEMI